MVNISDIQGSGSVSPLAGQTVQTSGIVTLRKSNGFYLQSPDAQGRRRSQHFRGASSSSPASAPPAAAAVGNSVQVTGTVTEFKSSSQGLADTSSTTELTSPSVVLLSSSNPLPTPITLTASSINPALGFGQLERYEGMARDHRFADGVRAHRRNPERSQCHVDLQRPLLRRSHWCCPAPSAKRGIEAETPLPIPGAPHWDGNLEIYEIDFNMPGDTAIDATSGTVVTNVVGVLDYFSPYYVINHDPATSAGVERADVGCARLRRGRE